jgi:5-methylcytosine-specific restriction endonuclease McrA
MPDKPGPGTDIVAAARRARAAREAGYRERALKLFPHVCARCGREFSGKRLRELTVHHKDHDHDHNPPDGSNWELLCLYCHDNEHGRDEVAAWSGREKPAGIAPPPPLDSPFAGLAERLKRKQEGG